ncbi:MAG: DUF1330 domain-containing protein [Neptuniibacter sp.]
MTVFFIASSTIKSPEKFQLYAQKAGATFSNYGGKPVLRGKFEKELTAFVNYPHQMVGIISFPSLKALNNWYQSDEYQALISLRDEAAEMTITIYSVPT